MRRLPWTLMVSAALMAPAAALALEPPPVYLGDLAGSVHGGFDRVNQFAVRSDGRVYIADSYNNRIVVYSPDGRYLEQIGSSGSALGQFSIVSGVAFDASGNLFVANQTGNRITKLSPTHLPMKQFGSGGHGPGQLSGPDNIAVSPYNGRLYVAELFGDRVSVFDTDGNFMGSFGSTGKGPGQFDHPAGIVVDDNGDVFVADQYNSRIERFSASGAFQAAWGSLGSAPGQFNYTVGLAFDQDHNLYVTDQLNNRVQKFTRDGTLLAVWGSFGNGAGQMYNPWAVQPLPDGHIWVGDTWNHRVSVYGPGAAPAEGVESGLASMTPPPLTYQETAAALVSACSLEPPPAHLDDYTGSAHGGFDRISQFALRSDGRVYLVDEYHNRVVVYDQDGRYLEQIGSIGNALGQFNIASGLTFDGNDNLFVANQVGNRITKLSPTHLPLMQFGTTGSGPGQLMGPDNLAFSSSNGRLYVAELFGGRVSMFDANGVFIGSFGGTGSGPGQFDHPAGVIVDDNGDVFVADQYNSRIERFDASGVFQAQWGSAGSAPGEFNYTVGLGFDQSYHLYVTDQLNNRVQKFTRDGTLLTLWGSFGDGPGQMYNPWAVLPLPDGRIWVGDTWNHRISVYGPGGTTPFPQILSIADVPEDNGYQVRIHFTGSSLDAAGSPTPILQYEGFRRIDASAIANGAPAAPSASIASEAISNLLLAGWEYVGAVPAHAESEYYMVAPTLVNSTSHTTRYSVFFIRAATAAPATFFDSCPDSGASVDNLPPHNPSPLNADLLETGDVTLTWEPNGEADFLDYSLYRGTTPDFAPTPDALIATTTSPGYVDRGAGQVGSHIYYKLSAWDLNGNQSGFAVAEINGPVSSPTPGIPDRFALFPVAPNPVAGDATFQFDLPVSARATLRIYDVHGRLVRTLGDGELPPGRYRWEWNGRGDTGSHVPAGVYFYRLQTPVFSKTLRMSVTD